MSLLIVGIGVALLTVPALCATSALGPRARVRAACASATAGIWLLGIGVLLTASPLLLWWHDQGEVSAVDLGHLAPGGPWAWMASGVIGGVGASWLFRFFHQSACARRRASLPPWAAITVLHDHLAGAEVRVAPTLEPVAFAVPGRDRHVVVSESVNRLAEPQRRAVLAHEGAHLRLRHDRHLLVLGTYQRIWGWAPGARSVVAAHRRSIEEWADLEATRHPHVDSRAMLVARAQLRGCDGTPRIDLDGGGAAPAAESLRRALVGVTATVVVLIAAGAYSVIHTVGDATAIVAALH